MMFRRPRVRIFLLLSLLVLISATAGFFVGVILAQAINKKKDDPKFWKEAAVKHLEKLHPDDAQRKKFEALTDAAVKELTTLRKEGIRNVWTIIERTMVDVEKELTPEQRETFDKIKPKKPAEAE